MEQTTRLNDYRQRILQVLNMHAQMKGEPAWIQSRVERDELNNCYRLIDRDPHKNGGTDYIVVELKLADNKVWIVQDGIEYGIAEDLLVAGIAPDDIREEMSETDSYTLPETRAA